MPSLGDGMRKYSRVAIGVVLLGFAPGCYRGGQIDAAMDSATAGEDAGDSEGDGDGGNPEIPEDATVGGSEMRRLSAAEYANTIRALFGDAVADGAAGPMAILPSDRQDHGYASMARGVTAAHIEAHFQVAETVAALVAADPDERARLHPCLVDGDASCLDDAIASVGRRAFRRPARDDERAMLRTAYDEGLVDGHVAALEDLIVATLMSPAFLYKLEEGKSEPVDGIIELTDYELATRLSYMAWGAPPDDALLDAAEAGELSTQDGMDAQVDRLFDDPRATQWRGRFFDELWGLDLLPTPPNDETFLDGVELDGLPEAMRAETQRFITYVIEEQQGDFAELMTSPMGFIESDVLAEIYGVAPSTEGADLPGEERAGLLTRAALLVGTQNTTAPIHRGAHVLDRVLCTELSPPDPSELPDGAELEEPPFDPDKTARERWTEVTSEAACAGCHNVVNPLGFAMEGYDSLGRSRDTEQVFDLSGEIVGELPVDTTVSTVIDGANHDVDDLIELSAVLGDSESAAACFASQWFRFSHGRRESTEDREHLDRLALDVQDGQALDDVMRQLAKQPEFRLRRVSQ